MIPTTAAGLLVVLLAVLPGVPGDQLFREVAGVSWRERESRHYLRLLTFSLLGLALYAILASVTPLPLPEYVIPSNIAGGELEASDLALFGVAYFGHFASAAVVGALSGLLKRGVVALGSMSGHRDAWDHFVNFCVPHHWVIVTLNTGETYAGILDHADVAVEPDFRDIVLSEPAELDPDTGQYTTSTYQLLFLRGADIASMVTVYDPDQDQRVIQPATAVFD